jgi:hypothetical protein
MPRITFDEISVYGQKSGKCGCGKQRTRRQKFWMTESPFNRNEDGSVRTRPQIYEALAQQVAAWKREPITCADCEGRQ